MSYRPDPDDMQWDDDMGAYRDSESGEYYRDEEGTEPLFD